MYVEMLLLMVFIFIMLSIIDVLSGYKVGFLHLLGWGR
jgi:hypothetical protein